LALTAVAADGVLRWWDARLRDRPAEPGPAVIFLGSAVRCWLTLIFVPALAIRYGVTFGTPELAAACGAPRLSDPPELVSQVRSLLASAAAVCWLVGLAAGSSSAWVTWVLSDCRVRPVTLYTVWLATTIIMATLAIR
jgi:hypothetical protein